MNNLHFDPLYVKNIIFTLPNFFAIMKRILAIGVFIIVSNFGSAQIYKEYSTSNIERSTQEGWTFPIIDNYNGTYQFIVIEKKDFLLTSETFELIERSRKLDQETILDLSPYLKVLIPSKNSIENSTFVPFEQVFILNQ